MQNDIRRPRGRPRDRAIDRRIVDATLRVVAERGIGGAAMDEIALRSGVSKATIYGRWPSKEALCVDAFRFFVPDLPGYTTSDPRADCTNFLNDLLAAAVAIPGLLPRIIAEISGASDLARIFRQRVVDPPRAICEEIVRRAISVRQLATATNVGIAVDLLIGPIFYRRLIEGALPFDSSLCASVVNAVWTAFAPT